MASAKRVALGAKKEKKKERGMERRVLTKAGTCSLTKTVSLSFLAHPLFENKPYLYSDDKIGKDAMRVYVHLERQPILLFDIIVCAIFSLEIGAFN